MLKLAFKWDYLSRCFLLMSLLFFVTTTCLAEELEPRRWSHLPINSNFLGAAYAHTDADISFDPVLKIENAQAEVHTYGAKYIRTFSLFEKSARISLLQGYQEGRWEGLLDGVNTTVKRSGMTDTLLRFAVNLVGAPPLKGKDYARYRATHQDETIVGAALAIQLPTGDYMEDKLINLGSNRFIFRPQIGAIHTRGKLSWETTGTVAIYSDNDEFFNGNKLEQDPLYSLNGHFIYTYRPGVWNSASVGYGYGGQSTVNGEKKDDRKQFIAWAVNCGFPLHHRLGVKLNYIGTRTQEPTGSDSDTVALSFSTFW